VYLVSVFSCSALYVSISHMIGCENRLENDVDYVYIYLLNNNLYSNSCVHWNMLVAHDDKQFFSS